MHGVMSSLLRAVLWECGRHHGQHGMVHVLYCYIMEFEDRSVLFEVDEGEV